MTSPAVLPGRRRSGTSIPLGVLACALCVLGGGEVISGAPPAPDTATSAPPPALPVLDVQWSEPSARTGKIVLVDVAVAASVVPIRAIEARLDDRDGVSFPVSDDRRRWRVLLPIDIDERPRPLPLLLAATLVDGQTTTWRKPIPIRAGAYDRRAITVGKQFTSPSAAQKERAAREAEELSTVLKTKSPDRLWRGSFAKPTPGAETSPFGTLRTYNKKRRSRHLGLDLDGNVGDPIVASNRGRVLLATERFYSGGSVVLDHGGGLLTMYFHMSRIDVTAGRVVEKGEALGAVGASGQVTGPHLHFAVRLGGTYVDPSQLLGLDLSDDAEEATATRTPR